MSNVVDAIADLSGAWTWYNDPRAIYSPTYDALYYASIRSTGVVNIDSWHFTPQTFHSGTPRTSVLMVDDHCNPSIIELDNGELLCAYSEHASGDSFSARSQTAGSIRTWDTPVAIGTSDTYANLIQMGDTAKTVFRFFRDDGDDTKQKYNTSTDRGDTWSGSTTFLEETGERPYVKYWKTSGSRIDFCATTGHPHEVTCNLYAGYLNVASNGAVTAFKSDGTSVSLPANPSDFSLVYDGTTTNVWNWDIRNVGGTPVIAFTTFASSNTVHTYWQARYTGGSWVTDDITTGGTTGTADYLYVGEPEYSGGISLDPNSLNVVYLVREYGAADFRLEKWEHTGTFGSGSWSKTEDTSGNTSTVNARPYAVDCNGTTYVLWWEGSYTSYTEYNTRLRISPAFEWLNAKPSSPSYSSTYAPAGVQAYYLINEGSGTSLADLTGNGYAGTFVSTPAWNAAGGDDYGAYLNGFADTKYVAMNGLATAFNSNDSNYPVWIYLLYKQTDTSTDAQWPFSFGRSSDTTPVVGFRVNADDATEYEVFWRDDGSNLALATGTNALHDNGSYNVLTLQKTAADATRIYLNGSSPGPSSTSTGAITIDRATIGALVRSSVIQPFLGEVHAVIVGWGNQPDVFWMTLALIQGQFSGAMGAGEEAGPAAPGGTQGLFRVANMSGLGSGGPFFTNPMAV